MKTIILRIKEDDKAAGLLRMLRDISYVEVEEKDHASRGPGAVTGLKHICGLWRGRDVTNRGLRGEAWARRGVSDDTD